jgi:predicted permease
MLLFGAGGPPIVHVRRMADEMTARGRPALLVLAAGVVCVLLIACANVANMYLSRGIARQRELTVRAAIGASRGRIARQLFTESAVLAVTGGALGLVLAWALVRLAPALASRNFPRLDAVAIDARVIVFAAAASVITALVTGMMPALRGARFNLAESLHGGDGATAGGFRGLRARRLRDALLGVEAAFAVLVLVAAVLLARSFVHLISVDAGYTAEGVLTARVYVPGGDGDDRGPAMNQLVASLVERARAMPGVVAAGGGNMTPLDNTTLLAGFPAPWEPPDRAQTTVRAVTYLVTPGFGEAIGLRLKAGRLLRSQDQGSGRTAWVVNEEFARLYLPPNPLGYTFTRNAAGNVPARTFVIVGIVGNMLKNGNDTKPQPEFYAVPRLDGNGGPRFFGRFDITVRTAGNPAALAPELRALVRDGAPDSATEIETLSSRVAESVGEPRFAMTILVMFALLALALASVGLYGVLSYGVSQRRRELGVRAALGASRRRLVTLVIGEALAVTSLGLAAGLIGAWAATRLMQGALFGISPLDPVSFAAAPIVLVPVAIVSAALPALRAASTDPAEALRCE